MGVGKMLCPVGYVCWRRDEHSTREKKEKKRSGQGKLFIHI